MNDNINDCEDYQIFATHHIVLFLSSSPLSRQWKSSFFNTSNLKYFEILHQYYVFLLEQILRITTYQILHNTSSILRITTGPNTTYYYKAMLQFLILRNTSSILRDQILRITTFQILHNTSSILRITTDQILRITTYQILPNTSSILRITTRPNTTYYYKAIL